MNSIQKLWVALIAVAIVAVLGLFTPAGTAMQSAIHGFGGVTNYDVVDATAMKIGGTNGTRLGPVISTTCNLSQSSAGSHAATTSKEYLCAVTGVSSGDTVLVSLPAGAGNNPTGASSALGGFSTNGIGYATTTGFIGVQLVNLTGAATSSFMQATTSVTVTVLHPVTSVPGL